MNNEQLTVLSYGGGQDSTALLYKYVYDAEFRAKYAPGRFLVIMAATLDEHPETDKHVAFTKLFCAEHKIEFVHITPDMGFHGKGKWQGYRQFLRATSTCGSKVFRKTCTDNLKLKPFCCRQAPCPFGTWNEKEHRFEQLSDDNRCRIYQEILDRPHAALWHLAPAFGAGCCSSGNPVRRKLALARSRKDDGSNVPGADGSDSKL